MSPSPWQKLRRALGLKTIEDRIESVQHEAQWEEQAIQQEFYYRQDRFAHEQEALQDRDDAYEIGLYETARGDAYTVKIPPNDFKAHKYIIGTTGTGKTYFIENLLVQHIWRGDGAGVIDVHGDLYERLCGWIAIRTSEMDDPEAYLRNRVVFIDLTDDERIPAINPLQPIEGITSDRLVNQLILIMRRFYGELWGVKIEELARFGFLALSEAGYTLLELEDLLSNEEFRVQALQRVQTPEVHKYFAYQYQRDTQYVGSILNKLRPLLLDRKMQAVLGQKESTIRFRRIIDQGKILLVNLNKSYLSANADLVAAMLMGWLQNAALSRRSMPDHQRRPFYLYCDEFQNFANEQFEEILTETRKYAVFLAMAHQSLAQLDVRLRHIALGNTDLHCIFRTEAADAEQLAKGMFEPRGGVVKEPLSPYEIEEVMSEREEQAAFQKSMSGLKNRRLYYFHKGKPYKARLVQSLDVESPVEKFDRDPEAFAEAVQECLRISKAAYTNDAKMIRKQREERARREVPPPQVSKKSRVKETSGKADDIIPDIADFREQS